MVAEAIRVQAKPPLMVFQTREAEKWKNTRPVASRLAGAGMIAVKNPKPAESFKPDVADAQFWSTSGGVLLRFVRMLEPCALPSTVFVLAWL